MAFSRSQMVAQGRWMMRTDVDLQRQVLDELRFDPRVCEISSATAVLTNDGIVTLSGRAQSYAQKLAAEESVSRLKGVRRAVNDLEVIPTPEEQKPDGDIQKALQTVLAWNSSLAGTKISSTVDHGWVFLEGTVQWAYQREMAEQEAGQMRGVHGVSNAISIKPQPLPVEDMQRRISDAFARSALVDRLRVNLLISGDQVILRGKVRSWAERLEASRIAWSSPGVRSVDNQLTVEGDGPI